MASTIHCTLPNRKRQSLSFIGGQSIEQDAARVNDIEVATGVPILVDEDKASRIITDELPTGWHISEQATEGIHGNGWRARQVAIPKWVHQQDPHVWSVNWSL